MVICELPTRESPVDSTIVVLPVSFATQDDTLKKYFAENESQIPHQKSKFFRR
jgi:hypothetical protein